MPEAHSRRQLLSLAAVAPVSTNALSASDNTQLYPVLRYQISLAAAGGGLKVRLTTAVLNQEFDIDLADAETRGHFMTLIELAVAGRGRLSLEVETDGKTVRSFVLHVP